MQEQFVTYEISLKLKELGFDEECLASYYTDDERNYSKNGEYDVRKKLSSSIDFDPFKNDFDNFYKNSDKDYYVAAPLWQQVIDWFRKEYDMFIQINPNNYFDTFVNSYSYEAKCKVYKNKELDGTVVVRDTNNSHLFYSSEEAREQAILKAIELCKNN